MRRAYRDTIAYTNRVSDRVANGDADGAADGDANGSTDLYAGPSGLLSV